MAHQLGERLLAMHNEGKLVPCIWHLQPLYFLMNIGRWDESSRGKLRSQLLDGGVDAFALQLYGGNYSTDAETVENLVGRDWLNQEMRRRLEDPNISTAHPSVLVALKKGTPGF